MHRKKLLDLPITKQLLLVEAKNLESLTFSDEASTDSEAFDRDLSLFAV